MQDSTSIIDHFFKEFVLDIPVYQRNYEWKNENCSRLFDDLIELTQNDSKKHFFGTVIYQIDQNNDHRVIIDGQQRLTTIAILLTALRDMVNEGKVKYEKDRLIHDLSNKIVDQYDKTVFLHPVKNDIEAYESLVKKGIITENSNICNNYLYFRNRIETMPITLTADDIFESICRLHIMIIRLNYEDDPQAIFESINSTGVSLTEGDRVRNYILMNAETREQNRIYDTYWNPMEQNLKEYNLKDKDILSKFFRDYFAAVKSDAPRMDSIYSTFRKYANIQKNEGTYEEFLKDVLHYSEIYKLLLSSDLDKTVSKDASVTMHHINYIEATVTYPFIMRVLDLRLSNPDLISSKDVEMILKSIENMLVRRLICNIPPNSLNKIFLTLFKAIETTRGDSSFVEKMNYILLKKEGSARYPLDSEVISNLRNINLYDRHKTCALVLSLIEKSNKDTIDTLKRVESKELTIEHIMPQNPSNSWMVALGENASAIREEWTHRLGNLTLTAYNSEYSNRPYKEKRECPETGFLESRLKLNRYMQNHDVWGVEQMNERNELLVNALIDSIPELKSNHVPVTMPTDGTYIPLSAEKGTFTNLMVTGYVLNDVKVNCSSAADTFISLLTELCNMDPDRMAYIDSLNDSKQPGLYLQDHPGEGWGYIGNNMYAYHSCSNYHKFRVLKQVVELMGMDPGEVKIIAKPKKEKKASAEIEE